MPSLRLFFDKRIVIALVSAIILVGFICSLLVVNYKAQIRLHQSAIVQMANTIDRQARAFGYFFYERLVDIKDMSEAREISIFFENKDLGMSMDYGLRASLIQMEHRFDRLLEDRKINGRGAYRCIMFIDEEGNVLARRGLDVAKPVPQDHLMDHLSPDQTEPTVFSFRDAGKLQILIGMAYRFKGRYAGQILASINTDGLCGNLMPGGAGDNSITYFFEWSKDGLETCFGDTPDLPLDVTAALSSSGTRLFSMAGKNGEAVEMIAVKQIIPDTPFAIAATAPVSAIWGYTRPIDLLIAMGGLAILAVGMLIYLWIINTNTLILKTRLHEENIRKAEIEQKNIELEAYQDKLEDLVKQRTKELEDAQRELVHQAMEAGRAQLSAMTLHNIGNAITPVSVYTEMLSTADETQTLRYLKECYDDLLSHKDDLAAYVTSDPRGVRVVSYMNTLIDSLSGNQAKSKDIVNKIMTGVSYMAQVLTLQQFYAPEQVNMKEKVNMNILVADALNMQESTLSHRGIRLETEFARDIPVLMIEKNKLMQVVVNLIKNSCDALKDRINGVEKVIAINTYHSGNRIGLTLKDTGVGVPEEKLKDIFAMGVSTKGSSGFGLYYCKSFVEANNGSLTLTSRGPGEGAVVTMEFAIENPQPKDPVKEMAS